MKVVFRCDASLQIGSGHVWRCLALADFIKTNGGKTKFICRNHPGSLIGLIQEKEHPVSVLPLEEDFDNPSETSANQTLPQHAAWLGANWEDDASQTKEILEGLNADWLVVDHYALDYRWEKTVADRCKGLMVIDDLTDRNHACDLLLNQNFGRDPTEYKSLLPPHSIILAGATFALLRPGFSFWRERSLKRRKDPKRLERIMISMGGVDLQNMTEQVLHVIKKLSLSENCIVRVVMGQHAVALQTVVKTANQMPFKTEVMVNISNMEEEMAEADLVIGAAGSTSWERCCLGVPSIMIILADNQIPIARALEEAGAAFVIYPDSPDTVHKQLLNFLSQLESSPQTLASMSQSAQKIADGQGCERVFREMTELVS